MLRPLDLPLYFAPLVLVVTPSVARAVPALLETVAPACLVADPVQTLTALKAPLGLTGRVGLYIARVDASGRVTRAVAQNEQASFPLASAYKQAVAFEVLRQVDAGRLALNEPLETTAENRSIEAVSWGKNPISRLLERQLVASENTASDLLHLRIGLSAPQRRADDLGLCHTRLTLPTKAFWTAQAGLGGPGFPAGNLLEAAQRYSAARGTEQLDLASSLVAASQQVLAPQLEAALDDYFHGPRYDPRLEVLLQNVSTPLEFSRLISEIQRPNALSVESRTRLRGLLARGCCRLPLEHLSYWGGKAGSGWRILTLTGWLELPGGVRVAYAYFNDESHSTDAEVMETQIPLATRYIASQVKRLLEKP